MKIEITKSMALCLIPAADDIANKMKDNVMSAMVEDNIAAIKLANKALIEAMELKKALKDAAEGCEAEEPAPIKPEVVMLPEKPRFRTTFKSFQSGGMSVPSDRGDHDVMVGGYRYDIKVREGRQGTTSVIVRIPDSGNEMAFRVKSEYDDVSEQISLYIVRRGERGRYSSADRKNALGIMRDVKNAVDGLLGR